MADLLIELVGEEIPARMQTMAAQLEAKTKAMRLGERCGADPHTFAGLAGVGDVVACGSLPSHPGYAAGRDLGAGKSIQEWRKKEVDALLELARREGEELPLTEALAAITARVGQDAGAGGGQTAPCVLICGSLYLAGTVLRDNG